MTKGIPSNTDRLAGSLPPGNSYWNRSHPLAFAFVSNTRYSAPVRNWVDWPHTMFFMPLEYV